MFLLVLGAVVDSKQRLQQHFSEFPPLVHDIIQQLPDSIHEDYLRDINIPTEWSKGPVALIGDAVHALTPGMGQGANQGLEDVCELVERIVHNQPLTDYTQARLERVQKVQEQSRQNTIQSNSYTQKTASVPFQRRKYSQSFQDWLYDWKPTSFNGDVE